MQRRRRFLRLAAGAGGIGLAGCSGTEGNESTPTRGSAGTTGTRVGTADGEGDDGPSVGVLSPDGNTFGTGIRRGARLAANRLNADGGVSGGDLTVRTADTGQTEAGGEDAYGRLSEAGVDVTVGVLSNASLRGVLPRAVDDQRVHLTTGARSPAPSREFRAGDDRGRYHFRPGPLNTLQLEQAVVDDVDRYLDLGWERIGLLLDEQRDNGELATGLRHGLQEGGVDVVAEETLDRGYLNFEFLFDDFEDAEVDAVIGFLIENGAGAVFQWQEEERSFEFGGFNSDILDPRLPRDVAASPRYAVSHDLVTAESAVTEKTQPFVEAYRASFGDRPPVTAFTTYDAVMQYADVVERVGTTATEAVVDGLEESSYTGTYGTIEYHGPDGDHPHDVRYGEDRVPGVTFQWQGAEPGRREVVGPDTYRTGEYVAPSWL